MGKKKERTKQELEQYWKEQKRKTKHIGPIRRIRIRRMIAAGVWGDYQKKHPDKIRKLFPYGKPDLILSWEKI